MNNGISYFFMGAGIGLGIAMLFAPKSGTETRALIRDKAMEGADYVKNSGMELRDKAYELTRKPAEAIAQQKDGWIAAVRAGQRAYAKAVNS
jgi:gas vesicle protein